MSEVIRSVGRYEIERELGRGGMARVFLARQTDLDRLVALKELSAFHASDPQFAQRFLRESRLAGSLSHPNIVTVHEYFEHDGTPYIAMEYVPRGSLRPYVGKLSLAQVVGVVEGILAGLTHAESKGIVHRDLKPENVMVTDEGRIKITDFGIAKASSGVATGAFLTATGTTVGTPAYMAPEQAMAQEVGPWTDLYSLGMMAYEMLVGRLPWADTEAPMVLLMKQVNERPPSPRELNPDLDEDLAAWIERLIEKDPTKRPQTAADAWDEMEESVIRIFGARWRREARLPATAAAAEMSSPLTPAPFDGTIGAEPGLPEAPSDEFQSFAWNKPAPAPVAPAAEAAPPITELPSEEPLAPVAESGAPVVEAAAAGVAEAVASPVEEASTPAVEEAPAPETEEAAAPEVGATGAQEPPAEAAVEAPAEGFKTYGRRRPPPAPQPPPAPEPVVEAEPEPEPEEEWSATIAPSRAPEPEPVAEPAPAAAAAESAQAGRGRRVWVLVGAAVIAAAIGFLVAPSSSKKATPRTNLASTASSGGIQLGFPAAWRHAAAAPAIAGLPLKSAIALGGPTAGATIVAGMSTATGQALLPQSFLARVSGTPRPVAVKLGSVAAYRYAGLNATGPAQRLTAYVVPTDAGVATIACVGAAAVASPDCELIATSLQLQGPHAFALGPSAAYAKSLGDALAKLNTAAGQARTQLAAAKTPAAEANAARSLSGAYDSAAATLRGLSTSPADAGANAALTAAFATAGRDYAALATAAKRSDRKAYARAAAAVKRDEARAVASVSGLRSLGYAAS